MENKKRGILVTIIVGIVAIFICVYGYNKYMTDQDNERIKYSLEVLKSNQKLLNEDTKKLTSYYLSDEKIFLKKDIDLDDINDLRVEIYAIPSEAQDFDISKKELPKKYKSLDKKKKSTLKQADDMIKIVEMQDLINELFDTPVENFSVLETDELSIKHGTGNKDIQKVRDKISSLPHNQLRNNMDRYVNEAEAQVNLVTSVKEDTKDIIVDGKITNNANYETVENLKTEIEKIRNMEYRNNYNNVVSVIENQLYNSKKNEE